MFKKIALGLLLGVVLASSCVTISQASTNMPSLQERKNNRVSSAPHWDKTTINVYIPKDSKYNSVRSAFGYWQSVSSGKLHFNFVNKGPADIDVVFLEKVSGIDGPLGECVVKQKDNKIIKAEIKLATKNSKINKYSNDYVYTTIVHEVGHALGLPDISGKPTSIMHTPITESQDIKKMDIKNLFMLYDWSLLDRR